MTVPLGDMPDWQVQVTPPIQIAAVKDITAGLTQAILSQAAAFRIWGLWMTLTTATAAAFAGGPSAFGASVVDGNNVLAFRLTNLIALASQNVSQSMAIPVNGWTPGKNTGLYTIDLITDAAVANMFTRASAGIFFSVP